MEGVFKIRAYMGLQYQTIYIKAASSGHAIRAAIKHGAVNAECLAQLDAGHPIDLVA